MKLVLSIRVPNIIVAYCRMKKWQKNEGEILNITMGLKIAQGPVEQAKTSIRFNRHITKTS